jgi:hypothetical protein
MRSTSQLGSLVASALVAVLVVGSALDTVEAQRRRGRDVQRQATSSAQESTLVFEGLPDGAEVFVDERPVGVGPLGPLTVDPGEHVVRVRLQGYTEHTEVIEVPRGAQRRLAVDLIALAHVVAVTTTPAGARLFVDDRFAGETPTDVELIDGAHSLRLTLRGYEDAVRTLEAMAGHRDVWTVELTALPEQAPPQWYEDPVTWIVTAASVVGVTALAVVIAVFAQPSSTELDQFCMPGDRCLRFDPVFP